MPRPPRAGQSCARARNACRPPAPSRWRAPCAGRSSRRRCARMRAGAGEICPATARRSSSLCMASAPSGGMSGSASLARHVCGPAALALGVHGGALVRLVRRASSPAPALDLFDSRWPAPPSIAHVLPARAHSLSWNSMSWSVSATGVPMNQLARGRDGRRAAATRGRAAPAKKARIDGGGVRCRRAGRRVLPGPAGCAPGMRAARPAPRKRL